MFDIWNVLTIVNGWRDTEGIKLSVISRNWRWSNIRYSWPMHCEFTKVQKSHTSVGQLQNCHLN